MRAFIGHGRARIRAAVLLGWVLLAAGAAASEPAPQATGVPGAAAAAAGAGDDARVRELFAAGDYAGARLLVEREYERTHEPRLAFNLAVIHHHLGNCEAARDLYLEFLKHEPGEPGRSEALAALGNLAPYCGGVAASTEPVAVSPRQLPSPVQVGAAPVRPEAAPAVEQQPAPVRGERLLAWSLLGAGVVSGAGALFAWRGAVNAASDLENLSREAVVRSAGGETWDDCCRARGERFASAIQSNQTWSRALGFTSVLMLGSGLTLWLLDSEHGEVSVEQSAGTHVRYRLQF